MRHAPLHGLWAPWEAYKSQAILLLQALELIYFVQDNGQGKNTPGE